jgi:methylglyoxal synthase
VCTNHARITRAISRLRAETHFGVQARKDAELQRSRRSEMPSDEHQTKTLTGSRMNATKRIALVAHDNCKQDMVEWVEWNWNELLRHKLVCTGTTGKLVEQALVKRIRKGSEVPVDITKLKSGPFGGDQQLGAMIVSGDIDLLIFFWDPMEPQPHDVDVKALLRISVLYNIPTACNRSTADFIISSSLLNEEYDPATRDYTTYANREIKIESRVP